MRVPSLTFDVDFIMAWNDPDTPFAMNLLETGLSGTIESVGFEIVLGTGAARSGELDVDYLCIN